MAAMPEERVFPEEQVQFKAEDYHGGCRLVRVSPAGLAQQTEALNLEMSLEQALRLSLALQSALVSLNRYNRATVVGREMGVLLMVDAAGKAMSVIEKRIPPESDDQ
jgi:hypothetical protein